MLRKSRRHQVKRGLEDTAMKVGTLLHPAWLAESLLDPSAGQILAPLIERCVESGATHIELTGEVFTMASPAVVNLLEREVRDILLPYKKKRTVSFSLHLPSLGGLDVSSTIKDIRRVTLETYRTLEELIRPLRPENFILHVAGMIQEAAGGMFTGDSTERLRKLLLANVTESLEALCRFLEPEKICIENLYFYPMDFLASLIEELKLSVCLDIGHLAVSGESFENFLDRYGPRIREVHLHDVKKLRYGPYVSVQIDHQGIGQGELPLEQLLRRLHVYGFSGPVVLETLRDTGLNSIAHLKTMLVELNQVKG